MSRECTALALDPHPGNSVAPGPISAATMVGHLLSYAALIEAYQTTKQNILSPASTKLQTVENISLASMQFFNSFDLLQ